MNTSNYNILDSGEEVKTRDGEQQLDHLISYHKQNGILQLSLIFITGVLIFSSEFYYTLFLLLWTYIYPSSDHAIVLLLLASNMLFVNLIYIKYARAFWKFNQSLKEGRASTTEEKEQLLQYKEQQWKFLYYGSYAFAYLLLCMYVVIYHFPLIYKEPKGIFILNYLNLV